MPTVNSVGTQVGGTGGITVNPGATHTAGDIDIILLQCAASDTPSLSTANGFARITALNQSVGIVQMSVWWRRWNGTDGSPVFASAGDHQVGQMISVSGCKTTGDPWNVLSTGTTDSTADTSVSAAGATTTVANCLVLAMACQDAPDSNSGIQFGAPSNADLANLAERMDQSRNLGTGGAHWMASGEKATAGAYGATTCTATTSARRVCATLALEGDSGGTQALTGALFSNAPSFSTGSITSTRDLAGVLFANTPSFFTGDISQIGGTQDLAGVLFTKAPTFFQGTVAAGAVDLSGVLFQNAPAFFTGTIAHGAQALTGTLFTKAPSFFTGTITTGAANLAGVLFANTPSFFVGTVSQVGNDLTGVLYQNTPLFFQGSLTGGVVSDAQIAREAIVVANSNDSAFREGQLAREAVVVPHHFPEEETDMRLNRLGVVIVISRPHGWD